MPQMMEEKYVVLDVETNGLSSIRHDLLSISIYKPDDGKIFNKWLPLELNEWVYTTHINGITEADLNDAKALTQLDVDYLIEEFELLDRTILIYGNLDEKFIKHYFERKHISSFEKFHFYNFKRDIISPRFSGGTVTKDNMCRLYGIENVNDIHTGVDDCQLEWELFKKMNGKKLLITNTVVFEFNEEYIIPISFLKSHPNLRRCMNNLPDIGMDETKVYQLEISNTDIKKFPTNFNGIIIEKLINSMLGAKEIDSKPFLLENKRKLKHIGNLPSSFYEVPLEFRVDGTVEAINVQDKELEERLNEVINIYKKELTPLIEYILRYIFLSKEIMSQELMINKEHNVLALCDLSDNLNVLEIKTNYKHNIEQYKEQLYIEANGRNCYLLLMNWTDFPVKLGFSILKIDFYINHSQMGKLSRDNRTQHFQSRIRNEEIIVTEYVNYDTWVKLKCKVCEREWEASCDKIVKKPTCPFCTPVIKQVAKEKTKPHVDDKKKLRALNYITKVTALSKGTIKTMNFVGVDYKVDAECLKCGHRWSTRADHLISRAYCPMCKKNEKKGF